MINFGYMAYKWLTCAAAPAVVPMIWLHHLFRGDDFGRFYQRLGIYPECLLDSLRGRPRIWIHAVSVGEIGVAVPIIKALRRAAPQCGVVISTMKEQGLTRAVNQLDGRVVCFFAPLDILGPTRRALRHIKPDVLVCLETELWPNLIIGAQRQGVRTAVVNGRISVRTVKNYRRIKALMRHTLAGVDAFSMISDGDARRIASIGAPAGRIAVNGNAKFDGPDVASEDKTKARTISLLGITPDSTVIVAGSTRYAEEPCLLSAFEVIRKEFPRSIMIIAPRHVERSGQIADWAKGRGFEVQLRSQIDGKAVPRTASVVVLDTMGELSDIYSVANCVYCGGSLVPKGGQNILEPAMWAKPTLYGPSMEDFAEAVDTIQRVGGGIQVRGADDIAAVVTRWFKSPETAVAAGMAARRAVLHHRGAAQKHAAVIAALLP